MTVMRVKIPGIFVVSTVVFGVLSFVAWAQEDRPAMWAFLIMWQIWIAASRVVDKKEGQ